MLQGKKIWVLPFAEFSPCQIPLGRGGEVVQPRIDLLVGVVPQNETHEGEDAEKFHKFIQLPVAVVVEVAENSKGCGQELSERFWLLQMKIAIII